MKTIKNIDDKPAPIDDDLDASLITTMPSYRKMFKSALGMAAANNPQNAIDIYQIGLKFKLEGNSVSLEDAEFESLKKACESNPLKWGAHYFAQAWMKLKEAEKEN